MTPSNHSASLLGCWLELHSLDLNASSHALSYGKNKSTEDISGFEQPRNAGRCKLSVRPDMCETFGCNLGYLNYDSLPIMLNSSVLFFFGKHMKPEEASLSDLIEKKFQPKSHVCTRQRHTTARDRSTETCVTHRHTSHGHALHPTLAQEKDKKTCQSGLNGARAWTCMCCAQMFVLATTATGEGARANFRGADRGEDSCCATATNRRSGSSCASTQRVMKITPCVLAGLPSSHDLLI